MLGDNDMPSWVTMTMEREPSVLASLNRFGRDQAVIARLDGQPVGMYLCAEHPAHLNGNQTNLGYLGALRVNRDFRHRLRILRDGYASIRQLMSAGSAPFWYTSVALDNQPARRLLEANLRGMPRYQVLGEMVTLALPRARGQGKGFGQTVGEHDTEAICRTHNSAAAKFQFAPALTPAVAKQTCATFYTHASSGSITGCMALWNQQDFKQVVARAYRQPLAVALPLYNGWARLSRRVSLPRLNRPLDQTFLAFLAADGASPNEMVALVADALALCSSEVLTLGLHGNHPALPTLFRAFKPASYRTLIYSVNFDDGRLNFDDRPVQPEVSIL